MLSCPVHTGYAAKVPPGKATADCALCWAAYGHRRAYDDGLRSQGKAKGANGARSKAKGRDAVMQLAVLLVTAFGWHPDDALVKATSMAGCDLHLSPRAKGDFPYSIEVKNTEVLSIWAALAQAAAHASPEHPPILFFKRAKSVMYVALAADVFLALQKRAYGREAPRP